ncbi:MAG: TIGR03067 domain-containing protein [Gemmataceae bacterium]
MLCQIVAALLTTVASPAADAAGDLSKMAGTWKSQLYVAEGTKWSAAQRETLELTIRGTGNNTLRIGEQVLHGTYRLDEATSPRQIDITLTAGPDKGKKKLGIYELKGDVLRICVGPLGGERPKTFASTPGSGVWLEEWQRVK